MLFGCYSGMKAIIFLRSNIRVGIKIDKSFTYDIWFIEYSVILLLKSYFEITKGNTVFYNLKDTSVVSFCIT